MFFYFNVFYFFDGKSRFPAAITPVVSVTWSFRNHSNMRIGAQETFLIIIDVENH